MALIYTLCTFWAVVPVSFILIVVSLVVTFSAHVYANDGENFPRNILILNLLIAAVSVAYLPTKQADNAMKTLVCSGEPEILFQEKIQNTPLESLYPVKCYDEKNQ